MPSDSEVDLFIEARNSGSILELTPGTRDLGA